MIDLITTIINVIIIPIIINIKKIITLLMFVYGVISIKTYSQDLCFPTIAVDWLVCGIAFLPMSFIDFLILKKTLSFHKCLFLNVVISNLISTIIGLPIAWFIIAFIQLCLGGSIEIAWTIHYEGKPLLIYLGTFFYVLAPYLIISYLLKYAVVAMLMEKYITAKHGLIKEIKRSVWKANLYSYGFLCTLSLGLGVLLVWST